MLSCIAYLIAVGLVLFAAGRLFPKSRIHADRFPFCTYPFEQEGKLYERLRIRRWQNKVPDMSRILPGIMPKKRLDADYEAKLPMMIRETCIAELTHSLLCLSGLYCLRLWPGAGGAVLSVLNLLGNAVFIIIQRYNRPRLMRLQRNRAHRPGGKERICES